MPVEIPGFQLTAQLRAGLFQAREESTGRACRVRLIEPLAPGEDEAQTQLLRLTELSHPNLVQVLAGGVSDGRAWLAEEALEGPTLAELLEGRHGPLPPELVLGLAAQLGDALRALWSAELLHLGLTPTAVVVDPDGRARLGGFGEALAADLAERLAEGSLGVDALDYLGPERIEQEDEPRDRTDVYSLGALLYRCLAGRTPYSGQTLFTRLRSIESEQPPDVRALNPAAPDAIAELIAALMERDPDDRPLVQDVSELARRLAGERGLRGGWEQRPLAELLARRAEEARERARAREEADLAEQVPLELVLRGPDETFIRELSVGERLELGRSPDAGVCLPFRWVSRRHAAIERRAEGFFLLDLGSANGTVHNGTPITAPARLRSGDVVSLGNSHFEVTLQRSENSEMRWARCRSCGVDLDTSTRRQGSPICPRCQEQSQGEGSASDGRLRAALERLGLELLEPLPEGGFLRCYRVQDAEGPALAALAELGERAAEAFAEASAPALELRHPALLPARELLVDGGVLAVLYDPFPGQTLLRRVAEEGPCSQPEALRLGLELASAWEQARRSGVPAALLRPELVLVDDHGAPRLLGAGLAPGLIQALHDRVEPGGAQPCWEAPELEDVSQMTPTAAVWGLGATLAFALTGRPVAELHAGRRREPHRLALMERLPRELGWLLARATSGDPRDRPGSPASLAAELRALVESEPVPPSRARGEDDLAVDERTRQLGPDELPPELRG